MEAEGQQRKGEDRLSVLPDDLLLSILVRVDLRTAARTSILSAPWRRLPWLLPELNINVKDFVSVPHLERPVDLRTAARTSILMHNAMLTLTEATKSLLAIPRRESAITSLRLKLDSLNTVSSSQIGPLLHDAVDNGLLKDLHLSILDHTAPYFMASNVRRAQEVDGFFRAYPSVLHCLTRLSLSNLCFAQLDILFEHCKPLKHLTLSECKCEYKAADDSSVWKIDAPNSNLRVLKLSSCWFERIDLISTPKLEELDWDVWETEFWPLYFGFVPSLEKLCLSNGFLPDGNILKLSVLLHGAAGIHTLTLDFEGENIWVQREVLQLTSAFSKLKKLFVHGIFVEFDLSWITAFLEAAPSVEILHIGIWEDDACDVDRDPRFCSERSSPRWEVDFHGSKNLLLKELQIVGFRPLEQQLTFIRAILKRAPNLQAVVLKEDHKNCKGCNAITHNAPPWASTQLAFPKNKDAQDMVLSQVTHDTFFSGQILFS